MIPAWRLTIKLVALLILNFALAAEGANGAVVASIFPISFDSLGDGYAISEGGYVRFELPSGLIKWQYRNYNAYSERRMLVERGKVFIANTQSKCEWAACYQYGEDILYCLDSATGAKKWSLPGIFNDMAMDAAGRLFVAGYGTNGANIFRLNPESGEIIWAQLGVMPIAIALNGYVIANNGTAAFDPLNGRGIWQAADGAMAAPSAAIAADGAVIVPTDSGMVSALDPETGNVRWRYVSVAPLASKGAITASARGAIVLPVKGGLIALEGRTGRVLWENRHSAYSYEQTDQVIGGNNRLYSIQGAINSFDLETGASRRESDGSGYGLSLSPSGILYNYRFDQPLLDTQKPAPASGWPSANGNFRGTSSLERGGPPIVAGEPYDVAWRQGTNLYFSAAFLGSEPMQWQWHNGELPLVGETNRALSISADSLPPGSKVHLRATNQFGSVRTREALVGFEVKIREYGQGTVAQTPTNSILAPGTTVNLEATPPTDRTFKNWSGTATTTNRAIELVVTQNVSLKAIFQTLPGDVLWQVPGYLDSANIPVIDDEGFAYSTHTGTITKWDLETGEILFNSAQIAESSLGSPSGQAMVDAQHFYFFDFGSINAFSKSNGNRKWTYILGTRTDRVVLKAGKFIFSEDSSLVTLSAVTGEVLSKKPLPNRNFNYPMGLASGKVLFLGDNSSVIIDAATGTIQESLATPQSTRWAMPLADGDWAVVGGFFSPNLSLLSNKLPGINVSDMESIQILSGIYPMIFLTTRYYSSDGDQTRAFDVSTMTLRWSLKFGEAHFLLADNSIVCRPFLRALEGNTGKEKWRLKESLTPSIAAVSSRPIIFAVGQNSSAVRTVLAVQASAPLAQTPWPSVLGDGAGTYFPPPATPLLLPSRFGATKASDQGISLSFSTTRFGQYAIEYKDDLSQPRWTSLTNIFAESTNTTTFVPFENVHSFFRIKNLE